MPISKKDRIQREHKKLDALGLRAPIKPNGLPVKAAKPMIQCTICKGPFLADLPSQHKLHVDAKHPKSTPDVCFPPEALAACIAAAATTKPVAQKK